LNIRCRMNQR